MENARVSTHARAQRLGGIAKGILRVVPAEAREAAKEVVAAGRGVPELPDDVVVEACDEDLRERVCG